jgi:predicted amidohydrolase YtcJ
MVILDRDCFTVPDEDLMRTRSQLTIAGGRVVHDDGVL